MAPTRSGTPPAGSEPWRPTITTTRPVSQEPATDEPAIVQAVLGGDRDAFRVLVDRESAAVVRTCHRVLGDLAEAEDVAQETFVIAYRSLGTWRGDGPFGAWIGRIAVRLAIRQAGRRRKVAWAEPRAAAEHGIEDDPLARLPAGTATDPESRAIRGERELAVRAAVAGLAEPYREVVALRFFADRSLDEIAALTGRPLGTVKTHLHRGLIRLRGNLSEVSR
jgi:RNA polymerase sigma-70 factor (ECF subfamily)